MKVKAIIAGVGAAVLAIAAVAAVQIGAGDASARGGPGGSGTRALAASVHVDPDTGTALTADEAAGLQYMREEEKLAQNVYALLGAENGGRVLTNIARSETQHTETVKAFLDAFKVTDPAAGRDAGSFADDELQALYGQLVAQGRQSFTDAVNVGIAIEKRDIADLQARIAATDRADLKAMYTNLLNASQNHLNAFTRQLDRSASTGGLGYGSGDGAGQGQGYGAGRGGCWN